MPSCGRTTPSGRRRTRSPKRQADQAYDIPRCRQALTPRRITIRIARQGRDASARWGPHRGVVERTLAWLNRMRRLTARSERRANIDQAFLPLGCCRICFHALQNQV